MAQRSRQLLVEVYNRLVTDQGALKTLASSEKPLRAFAHELAALTSSPASVLGASDAEIKTTDEWLEQVEGMNGSLETLDKKLESRTFLSSNAPTAADYSLFASLYDVVSTLPAAAQHAHPSLVRYFSHMSHLTAGAKLDPPVTAFEPEFNGFPKIERKAEPKKEKKDKKDKKDKSKNKDTNEDDYKTTKKAKLGKRKRSAVEEAETTPAPSTIEEVVETTNVIANAHGQFVFQYLSNKLIRRKAEIAKQRREAGAWWGPS